MNVGYSLVVNLISTHKQRQSSCWANSCRCQPSTYSTSVVRNHVKSLLEHSVESMQLCGAGWLWLQANLGISCSSQAEPFQWLQCECIDCQCTHTSKHPQLNHQDRSNLWQKIAASFQCTVGLASESEAPAHFQYLSVDQAFMTHCCSLGSSCKIMLQPAANNELLNPPSMTLFLFNCWWLPSEWTAPSSPNA